MGVKWELTSCARASDDRAQSEGGVRGVGEVEGGGGTVLRFCHVPMVGHVDRRCAEVSKPISYIKPLRGD